MLSSITPLGERARGNRWGTTASAYGLGSIAGGLAMGCALGGLGLLLVPLPGAARLGVAGGLALSGAALDLARSRVRLPGVRRQVDHAWLQRYRGWVYGVGFGAQLGVGVVTIVSSAAVYAAFALALVAGSPAGGAVVGAAFGLARSAPLWTVRRIRTPGSLWRRHVRLSRLAPAGHWMAVASQALAGAALVAGAVAR